MTDEFYREYSAVEMRLLTAPPEFGCLADDALLEINKLWINLARVTEERDKYQRLFERPSPQAKRRGDDRNRLLHELGFAGTGSTKIDEAVDRIRSMVRDNEAMQLLRVKGGDLLDHGQEPNWPCERWQYEEITGYRGDGDPVVQMHNAADPADAILLSARGSERK